MKVTMVLPALTEATSPFFRPIKYSLFPPLGLATLAGYLPPDAQVTLHDEHVEPPALEDHTPDPAVLLNLATRTQTLLANDTCKDLMAGVTPTPEVPAVQKPTPTPPTQTDDDPNTDPLVGSTD